jgi:hypothetical protein
MIVTAVVGQCIVDFCSETPHSDVGTVRFEGLLKNVANRLLTCKPITLACKKDGILSIKGDEFVQLLRGPVSRSAFGYLS